MVWQSMIWIYLSGLIFAVFHSLTASQSCKHWHYQHGLTELRYRLLYSIIAIITTTAWVYFVHLLADAPLYQFDGTTRIIFMALQGLGLLILLASFQPIDGLAFLGLRQAKTGADPFIVRGIYRWLRHPMYVGAMMMVLAMPEQTWNGLHFSLVICAYFIVGSGFEERRMLVAHPAYADYRRRVGAFIPNLRG